MTKKSITHTGLLAIMTLMLIFGSLIATDAVQAAPEDPSLQQTLNNALDDDDGEDHHGEDDDDEAGITSGLGQAGIVALPILLAGAVSIGGWVYRKQTQAQK